jgi:hypothetical protein
VICSVLREPIERAGEGDAPKDKLLAEARVSSLSSNDSTEGALLLVTPHDGSIDGCRVPECPPLHRASHNADERSMISRMHSACPYCGRFKRRLFLKPGIRQELSYFIFVPSSALEIPDQRALHFILRKTILQAEENYPPGNHGVGVPSPAEQPTSSSAERIG